MKTIFRKYIVLLATLQVFLGCENIFEPPKLNVETGSFSLTINEANTGRTILPQTMQNDFAEYKLEFFTTGETTNPFVSISRLRAKLTEPVLLNTGTWDLYVTAYLGDQEGELKPAAQGKLLGIDIGRGEVVNGSVTLEPIIDSGEGTFVWNIVYPASVTSAKMTIHELNEGREGYNTVWYFIGGNLLIDKEGSLSLDAGYYRVVFELLDGQGRSAARREILHIYHNMESSFSCEFTNSNFLVEPLKAILAAWDEGWTLNQAGITADHFIAVGIDGVDDNNFDDIAGWFDTEIASSAADLSKLKVLVDVALVGIAGNDNNFCNAVQYANRAAAEGAIHSLVKNGTSVVIEWEQNDTVQIRLGTQHTVRITFNASFPCTYTAPASITVNGITASVTFNPVSPRPAGTQVTATVSFTGTAATEEKYTVNLTSIKVSLSGNVKTKTVSAGNTHTSETFNFTVPSQDVDDFILTFVENEPLEGKLLILQAYGSASDAAGASHSFVELYNTTDTDINLSGLFLYFAEGHRKNDADYSATEDKPWNNISLSGSIPAGGSFLILGSRESPTARYQISDNYGDINQPNFTLSNRMFKVALLRSTNLSVQNPFDINDNGLKAPGYIDMVGARNTAPNAEATNNFDKILGFETAPARNSASEAVRRKNLTDTDNNSVDFIAARYASDGFSNQELEVRKPRNSSAGTWDPFAETEEPTDPTVTGTPSALAGQLLILQAGASTNGAIARNFVELYNNTNSPITLTGTYSLQYTGATGTDWTVINLNGTIPAKGSFLVVGKVAETHSDNRLFIADNEADQIVGNSFTLNNNGFKVALMANQKKLTVANPFVMTGGKAKDYVDMLGAYNSGTHTDGFETAEAAVISKQAAARRSSLIDTDNNSVDFVRIDYRTSGTTNEQLAKFRPRYSGGNSWTPEF